MLSTFAAEICSVQPPPHPLHTTHLKNLSLSAIQGTAVKSADVTIRKFAAVEGKESSVCLTPLITSYGASCCYMWKPFIFCSSVGYSILVESGPVYSAKIFPCRPIFVLQSACLINGQTDPTRLRDVVCAKLKTPPTRF